MKVIRTIKEMQQIRRDERLKTIGFVPTMGYLHEGHTSLMKKATAENDLVVASIFVNPLQFGPSEDFETYPRDEQRDQQIAKENGVDILFLPNVQEMYPDELKVNLSIKERANVLCGATRDGHFDGVITVLTKLFNIVQPEVAYFGLKDAQQVAVVAALINDVNFPIVLSAEPTIREADGLAKSSRNVYLSTDERAEAKHLYKALLHGLNIFINEQQDNDTLIQSVRKYLSKYTSGVIDYVDFLSYPELKPVTNKSERMILAIAVKYKQARLIDNVIFNRSGDIIETIKF